MKPTHKKVIVLPLFKCTPNGLSLSDEKRGGFNWPYISVEFP